MRGSDERFGSLFSYVDLEAWIRADHPLRVIRDLANAAPGDLSGEFGKLYTDFGRPSIAPEKLLRAMLLQAFYGVRSERHLMERMEFDLLFRWFVGLGVDDAVWDHSTFSKNRDRLLEGEIAAKFLNALRSKLDSTAVRRDAHDDSVTRQLEFCRQLLRAVSRKNKSNLTEPGHSGPLARLSQFFHLRSFIQPEDDAGQILCTKAPFEGCRVHYPHGRIDVP
jgi:transposase